MNAIAMLEDARRKQCVPTRAEEIPSASSSTAMCVVAFAWGTGFV